MIDKAANVGKKLVCLELSGTCHPQCRAIQPPTFDENAAVAAINADLAASLDRHLPGWEWSLPTAPLQFCIHPGTRIMPRCRSCSARHPKKRPTEEVRKKAEQAVAQKEFDAKVDGHENNGQMGWWRVYGFRDDVCFVRTDHCRKAIEQATVMMPEMPEFLGVPDVLS